MLGDRREKMTIIAISYRADRLYLPTQVYRQGDEVSHPRMSSCHDAGDLKQWAKGGIQPQYDSNHYV
ncbi:hypothetical protein GB937_002097 [Aspergillus fischeri]|nr:hypothetical protein GB937_002097 [Aspergillus fischeri]